MKTVADLVFHEEAFDTIDFASDGLRENDKEIVSMMIQEMSEGKMLNENTPENIKRLRQKIGLTQKECAEIFSMSPRTASQRRTCRNCKRYSTLHQ